MSTRRDAPGELGELLRAIAFRMRKIDVLAIEEIQRRWMELVGDMLARRTTPEAVKNRVLIVRVPSGAFAERLQMEERRIVNALSDLGDRAPTSLKIVVGKPS